MHEKKIRGMKRKTNAMIKQIEEHTKTFPSTFYNDDYFHNFFNRNNEFQKWISLSNKIDFWKTWGISICPTAQILHFQEVIYDEDAIDKKEIWFIGELS